MNQQSFHPVHKAMLSITSQLTSPPITSTQACTPLLPVFNIHNAIRRSTACIATYLSYIDIRTSTRHDIQMIAKECVEWIAWYMPQLRHHHQGEDEYW